MARIRPKRKEKIKEFYAKWHNSPFYQGNLLFKVAIDIIGELLGEEPPE